MALMLSYSAVALNGKRPCLVAHDLRIFDSQAIHMHLGGLSEDVMFALIFWSLVAIGIFLFNHYDGNPFIGIRFTEGWLGHPLNGGWLASVVAVYCLLRVIWRKSRRPKGRTSAEQTEDSQPDD